MGAASASRVKLVFTNAAFLRGLLLVIATVVVYSQSLNHQFLVSWDDNLYVSNNPDICGFTLEHLRAAFTKFYVGNYAPLHIVSYMLDYTLWGLNPAGFIGANIVLHIMNGLLFYWLVSRITGKDNLAFFSALIFLLHPVQVESVVWIAQRKNVLAMFFFLFSLLSFVYYREDKNRHGYALYALAVMAFICALLTKSVTVVLPLVLVLYDICIVEKTDRSKWIVDKIPFVVAAFVVALITIKSQSLDAGGGIVNYPDESAFGIFLTMLTVFARYAGMLVWPTKLSIYYYTPIKAEIDAAAALSGILLVLACIGLYYLYRKNRALFFWAALVPVGILPVSQIVPLSTLMNDRYLYFPLLGAAVLLAWVLVYCCDRAFPRTEWMKRVMVCLIIIPLSLLSWQRAQVWSDSISIWSDALDKYPNFVTYAGAGNALYKAGRIDEAVEKYDKSLLLEPTCEEALRSLGAIYLNRGEYGKALYYIQKFVDNFPDNAFGQEMLDTAYKGINYEKSLKLPGKTGSGG